MSSVFIIDNNKIAAWKSYVENHEISIHEFMEIYNGKQPLVGNRDNHILYLDTGFRFVYSVENIPSQCGKNIYRIRKLSGSFHKEQKYPHPQVMRQIADLLGFSDFTKCQIKINDTDTIPNIEIHDVISIREIKN